MKKQTVTCMLLILVLTTGRCWANVESKFSFRINAYSTNIIGPIAYALISGFIPTEDIADEWYGGFIPYYDMMFAVPVQNSAPEDLTYGTMYSPYHKYFRQQIRNWGDWKVGVDGSWDLLSTPFGLFAGLYYKTTEVLMSDIDNRVHYLSPNFGMRLRFGNPYSSAQFIMELGGLYDVALGYRGAYNDVKAVNSGFTGRAAIGVSGNHIELLLQYDHPFYNYFNTSYTPDNGLTYPFQDVRRVVSYISLGIRYVIN